MFIISLHFKKMGVSSECGLILICSKVPAEPVCNVLYLMNNCISQALAIYFP